MIRRPVWERLSVEEQAALRRAARESSVAQRAFWREVVAEALEAVRAAGSEINEIDDVEAFQQAVEPLYDKYGAIFGHLIQRIRAVE